MLTALNLAPLLLTVAQQFRPAFAQGELSVLRGRGLEIVDAQGRVRASIQVLSPAKSQKGEDGLGQGNYELPETEEREWPRARYYALESAREPEPCHA